MQMIVYQLLTNGNIHFEQISEVAPFLEISLRNGDDLNRLPSPRILKTHLHARQMHGRPGKLIYVARNGKDVLVSYFRFHVTYHDYRRPFSDFFEGFLSGNIMYGSWFKHVVGWRNYIERQGGLWLQFEHMVQDPAACLDQVASFLGVTLSPSVRDRALQRSSFEFMKRYEEKFEPIKVRPSEPSTFLFAGEVGGWREILTEAQDNRFNEVLRSFAL
jgi:hypothetical protein